MTGEFGLPGAVSMALGGMIGGGIYAVLGVAVGITGPAVWAAFVLAGVVAMCAAAAYNALNALDENQGGTVTFVQSFVGNSTAAGMLGWTLLVGYVGSMAMYAFAFGEFALRLGVVPEAVAGVPARPVISVAAIAGFVGLNLVGARTTGVVEAVLVAAKLLVLLAFGVLGLLFVGVIQPQPIEIGLGSLASPAPIMAAAVAFVAFQGWQLLFYDQESIESPVATIRRAVYVSIPTAVVVYVLVGVATVNLAPQAIVEHPHTALATAAGTILQPVGLAWLGTVAIALSALVSTGSAINATLFSTGYFAKGMVSEDLLPDRVGDPAVDGVPTRTLLVLGVLTAALTVVGSLGAITSFASLAFIVVFGTVCAVALTQRDHVDLSPAVPALGLVGAASFLVLMGAHLYLAERGTFYAVLALTVLVVAVELLYFERGTIEREIDAAETVVFGEDESLPPNED